MIRRTARIYPIRVRTVGNFGFRLFSDQYAQSTREETTVSKQPAKKPAEKLHATKQPIESVKAANHDESVVDEALDESFPASDPPSTSSPGGSAAVKKLREQGRAPAKKP